LRTLAVVLGLVFSLLPTLAQGQSADARVDASSLDRRLLTRMVWEETNRYREEHGRQPVGWLEPLALAAQNHAENMVERNFFIHQNPFDPRLRTLRHRIARVGLSPRSYGENLALTFAVDYRARKEWTQNGRRGPAPGVGVHTYRSLARSLVQQWAASPGHKRNLLARSFSLLGVGLASESGDSKQTIYCVQTFASQAGVLIGGNLPGTPGEG